MKPPSLDAYIAGLDGIPSFNSTEQLIFWRVKENLYIEDQYLDCSRPDPDCLDRGKEIIEEIKKNISPSKERTLEEYEMLIFEGLSQRAKNHQPEVITMTFKDLSGEQTPLEKYFHQGKIVVIALWATWCSPCIAEVAGLNELFNRYSERINVISIAVQNPEEVSRWVKARSLQKKEIPHYPMLVAPHADVYGALFSNGGIEVPKILFFSPEGDKLNEIEGYSPSVSLTETLRNLGINFESPP